MTINESYASRLRIRRLWRDRAGLLVVPLDHAVTDGPVVGGDELDAVVGQLGANGVDAVVLHKGAVRRVDPRRFQAMSLVVHLSAGTVHAPDPDARCLVGSVEEALRLGADAVSVHVNVGSRQEQRQLADLGQVAAACDHWGLPLLAMMYARGPEVADPVPPKLIVHAAAIAADLGADLVKVPYAGSAPGMREVIQACPVPLVVAGGPLRPLDEVLQRVRDALHDGAAGVAIGRNVVCGQPLGHAARRLAALVHREVEMTVSRTGAPR